MFHCTVSFSDPQPLPAGCLQKHRDTRMPKGVGAWLQINWRKPWLCPVSFYKSLAIVNRLLLLYCNLTRSQHDRSDCFFSYQQVFNVTTTQNKNFINHKMEALLKVCQRFEDSQSLKQHDKGCEIWIHVQKTLSFTKYSKIRFSIQNRTRLKPFKTTRQANAQLNVNLAAIEYDSPLLRIYLCPKGLFDKSFYEDIFCYV